MSQNITRWLASFRASGAALILVGLVSLSGCAVTGQPNDSQGSRVTLYDSLEQLIADSAIIVSGTVSEQAGDSAGTQGSSVTISTVTVDTSFSPANVASSLPDGEARPSPPAPGSTVAVRQFGTPGTVSTGGPLLEPGVRYLLFLTPTALPGPAAADYFIVGSEAGIYRAEGERFTRVAQGGDRLPGTIDPTTDLR